MAEMKDAHIVEMVDEEHQQKLSYAMTIISAIQHHPLMEISESPGHLLLLKLWRREEDVFARRIARKESRMDSIRREIFQLCCFLLIFHGFFTTILFTSSFYKSEDHQVNLWRYWKVWNQLQRDKSVNRALTRCIQELRMKGASFDLSKEPQSGKRMKSSSVENKWNPLTCHGDLIEVYIQCLGSLQKTILQTSPPAEPNTIDFSQVLSSISWPLLNYFRQPVTDDLIGVFIQR
ncbi:hypothetical protein C1H46_009772 [Malus baccata]|uniref:Uncharacterized protein n=1 Tax=Malus baccata TaxID=106549 RepID=A0A540N0R1_MALBA|nr:hypothetical protein C1H46_009772 [Malus baccata]